MTDPRDLTAVRIDHALDRMWAGMPTRDDEALIADWVADDPARAVLINQVRTAAVGDVHVTPADTAAAWGAVAARMDVDVVRPITSARATPAVPIRTRVKGSWLIRAAALVAMIVGTATIRMLTSRAMNEVAAPRGQRISTSLPDGSLVTLAAGSRARWSRDFGKADRTVLLDGEAFFSVVHDTMRPFRVRARHGVIEDIGTRFAVRAWAEQPFVEVIVEEGRVSVRDTSLKPQPHAAELHAGQRGRLPVSGPLVVSNPPVNALAWVGGTLEFDNTPLSEALPVLERWYNVTIVVDSSLRRRRLSARFEAQPIGQLLVPLGVALDAVVIRTGTLITMTLR